MKKLFLLLLSCFFSSSVLFAQIFHEHKYVKDGGIYTVYTYPWSEFNKEEDHILSREQADWMMKNLPLGAIVMLTQEYKFSDSAEVDLVRNYGHAGAVLAHYPYQICEAAQLVLLDQDSALSIVKNCHYLTYRDWGPKAQLQLLERRDAAEFLRISVGSLTEEAQLKMLDLPNAVELYQAYPKDLCAKAQIVMLNKYPTEFMAKAIRPSLCKEAMIALFQLPNASRIFTEDTKGPIDDDILNVLIKHRDAQKLWQTLLHNYASRFISQQFLLKLTKEKKFSFIQDYVAAQKKLPCEVQVLLFETSHGKAILKDYSYDLCPDIMDNLLGRKQETEQVSKNSGGRDIIIL